MSIIKAGSGLPLVPNWAVIACNESPANVRRRLADQSAVCCFKIYKNSCSSWGSIAVTDLKQICSTICLHCCLTTLFLRNRCFAQTVEHPITMYHLLALAAVAFLLSSAQADDSSLPSDWRTGHSHKLWRSPRWKGMSLHPLHAAVIMSYVS